MCWCVICDVLIYIYWVEILKYVLGILIVKIDVIFLIYCYLKFFIIFFLKEVYVKLDKFVKLYCLYFVSISI